MTKTVAITGATGTLGRAVRKRFLQDWDWTPMMVCMRSRGHDVTDEQGVMVNLGSIAPVYALVTCAGVSLVKPLLDMTIDEWRHVLDVNLTGTFLAIREAVRHGATRIVTIGSIHGCLGSSYPYRSAYTASKGGVKALTEALAVELAPQGVAVNCVAPGHLPALMPGTGVAGQSAGRALLDAAAARTPTGRLVTPEEVAEVIFWLCDSAPLSLTGQTVTVDGGFTLNTWPMGE